MPGLNQEFFLSFGPDNSAPSLSARIIRPG
jgi:hypothetical protein